MPDPNSEKKAIMNDGFQFRATMKDGDWLYSTTFPSEGWVKYAAIGGPGVSSVTFKLVKDYTVDDPKPPADVENGEVETSVEEFIELTDEQKRQLYYDSTSINRESSMMSSEEANIWLNSLEEINTEDAMDGLLTTNLSGIFGIPYQFSAIVDRRLPLSKSKTSSFGRKYAEKIVAPMPLLFLSPGRANFMKGFQKDDKKNIIQELLSGGKGDDTQMDTILNGFGRYYSFEFDYAGYYKFVNPTMRVLAHFMNIGDRTITIGNETGKLANINGMGSGNGVFNWQNILNSSFRQYISAAEAIPFYMDSETTITENFSNSTTESMLSQKMNGLSDMSRELSFLMGPNIANSAENLIQSSKEGIDSIINEFSGMFGTGANIFKTLTSDLATVASGGKLLFPEIWSDSDFSRSYSINFKFRSPDADDLSIYLNCFAPVIHLVGLTAPHQLRNDANGYIGPYIVRGFCKGLFNVDMGIITDLSISRGKEDCWNANGLPTCIDVSMTIKDLYSTMFISSEDNVSFMMNNTALLDYLASMAGMNMNKPEVIRMAEMYVMLTSNKWRSLPNNAFLELKQSVSNLALNWFGKL